MIEPRSEFIIEQLITALTGISESAGYSWTPQAINRWEEEDFMPHPPELYVGYGGDTDEGVGLSYPVKFDERLGVAIRGYVIRDRGSGENLDRIVNLAIGDVKRAICNTIDWQEIKAKVASIASGSFQQMNEETEEPFYGFQVEFTIEYMLSSSDITRVENLSTK